MAPIVTDTAAPVPHALLAPLRDHLPHSFSVLRRAQFSHFPQGTTPHAHFLFASDPDHDRLSRGGGEQVNGDEPGSGRRHFAAAYLDLSQYPETQMYLYSTLQDADADADAAAGNLSPAEVEHVLDLLGALLRRVRRIAEATITTATVAAHPLPPPGPRREGLMVGGLHEATYRLLRDRRGLASSYWNPHDVWLFRVDELPPAPALGVLATRGVEEEGGGEEEKGGLAWGVVRREDVPLIASRTGIPKVESTLMSEPSVAVRDARGELVAWAFMGTAGTLSTLHVEVGGRRAHPSPLPLTLPTEHGKQEPYRGRGIAKAIATKVMREHNFGDDGWCE